MRLPRSGPAGHGRLGHVRDLGVQAAVAHADVRRVGAVSGLLSTLQQVGNAVGVAAIGLVFFGVHGSDRAFALSSLLLAVLLAVVALVAVRLPRVGASR